MKRIEFKNGTKTTGSGRADEGRRAAAGARPAGDGAPEQARPREDFRTEIVFILDASGSMGGLEDDTVGGFNSMLDENRDEPGEAVVSTILFSDGSRVLHDRIDIREVPALTRAQYRCRGCTALLDAVGGAIEHTDLVQRVQPEGYRADRVLFAITTDGMENASRRYTYDRVRRLIESHREQGWEFLFIGANIDAAAEAGRIGIPRENAADYLADRRGTGVVFEAMSRAVCDARMAAPSAPMPTAWRAGIDEDMRARGRRSRS